MPLISAVCRTSRRSFLPRRLACAGPENCARADTAMPTVSCREPPSVQPTQFSSVRAASFRTGCGRSAAFAVTMWCASVRVTGDVGSDPSVRDGVCGARGDKLIPPDARRKTRRFILILLSIELRELIPQVLDFRSVIDDDVQIVRMTCEIALMIRLGWIEDI